MEPESPLPVEEKAVRPSVPGTLLLVFTLFVTWTMLEGRNPAYLASTASKGSGIGILLSLFMDFKKGWRNMVRADVAALLSLYFLTLFEFLVPQEEVMEGLDVNLIRESLGYIFLGIGGLVCGRHLTSSEKVQRTAIFTADVKPRTMVWLYAGCFVVGYLHMALAVQFNVVDWWHAVLEPRFFQPWSRGRYGDWKAMLTELGMLLYLLPPLMGVVVARLNRYGFWSVVWMGCGTLITFFYGFSTGTRNLFCTYLVTFVIGYMFALKKENDKRILMMAGVAFFLLMLATSQMLHFRQIGFGAYLRGELDEEEANKTLFVDMNLCTLTQVVDYFPRRHDYLGWEIPYLAVIRPIPRAVWPGKPQGMSVSMEQVVGADEAYTVAASFVGEAYMSGGWVGILFSSLFFGALFGWWNRLGTESNSDWGILIYASGFFSAVITMRSLFVFTTAILPTLTALFIGYYLTREIKNRLHHSEPRGFDV
ncbi:MAG: O-antigen polymerase [Verrucomicrobiota bacterium]